MKPFARLTGANELAVSNWMGSNNRASAELLICLVCESGAVFDALLELSKRRSSIEEQWSG